MNIKNALVYDQATRTFRLGGLSCEDGKIVSFEEKENAVDFGGDLLIPGLVDVHTHGRGGYDFNLASTEQMVEMKRLYAKEGVTTVVPTLASDTFENLLASIKSIKEAGFRAVHVEGRYLNAKRRGAHAEPLLAPLCEKDLDAIFEAAGDMHVHISAAYELDADGSFLKGVLSRGGTAGLAHTDATFGEAEDAVSRGVRSFTHLFNAMPPIHHRKGGAIVAGLVTDAYTEIICDGFHLAPETVRLVQKAKTPCRVVLITDSMEGTGCPDGNYQIAGNPVILKDGKAYTEEGAIAGSTINLLEGLKNYADFCGLLLEKAVAAATENPAAMLGMADIGKLEVGLCADFIRLSPDGTLKEVYIGANKLN